MSMPKFPQDAKACPFCGLDGLWPIHDEAAGEYYLQCAVCHARGPTTDLPDLATWKWNRRQPPVREGKQP